MAISEKVGKLEEASIRMESSIGFMAKSIEKIDNTVIALAETINIMAQTSLKVDRLEIDVSNLAKQVRKNIDEVYNLSEKHNDKCSVGLADLEKLTNKRGKDRLAFGLTLVFGALTFVFGYFYLDFKDNRKDIHDIHSLVISIKETIIKNNKDIEYLKKEKR